MNNNNATALDKPSIDRELFDQWFDEKYNEKIQQEKTDEVGRLSIIATKGTMDMAYPHLSWPQRRRRLIGKFLYFLRSTA